MTQGARFSGADAAKPVATRRRPFTELVILSLARGRYGLRLRGDVGPSVTGSGNRAAGEVREPLREGPRKVLPGAAALLDVAVDVFEAHHLVNLAARPPDQRLARLLEPAAMDELGQCFLSSVGRRRTADLLRG